MRSSYSSSDQSSMTRNDINAMRTSTRTNSIVNSYPRQQPLNQQVQSAQSIPIPQQAIAPASPPHHCPNISPTVRPTSKHHLFQFAQKIQQIQSQQVQHLIQQQIQAARDKEEVQKISDMLNWNRTNVRQQNTNCAFRLYKNASGGRWRRKQRGEVGENYENGRGSDALKGNRRSNYGCHDNSSTHNHNHNNNNYHNHNNNNNNNHNHSSNYNNNSHNDRYHNPNTMPNNPSPNHSLTTPTNIIQNKSQSVNDFNTSFNNHKIGKLLQSNQNPKHHIQSQQSPNSTSNFHKSHTQQFRKSQSLPLWQRNLFHEKIQIRKNRSAVHNNNNNNTVNNNNNNTPPNSINPSPFPSLSQLHHSLSLLKRQSLSITHHYQHLINNPSLITNPQAHQQLVNQLKQTKEQERLLLDQRNKSFAGYSKIKSYMYCKGGIEEKIGNGVFGEMVKEGMGLDAHRRFVRGKDGNREEGEASCTPASCNITSYKINHLKPLKLFRRSMHHPHYNHQHIFLFDQDPSNPKATRHHPHSKHSPLQNLNPNSSQQQQEHQQKMTLKFKQMYKDKYDDKEIQRFIEERKMRKSREAVSPYHQLSAWS